MARFLEKNYKDFVGLMGKSVANIILTLCHLSFRFITYSLSKSERFHLS